MGDDLIERYTEFHDRIHDKRFNSPFWLRRYTQRQIHQQFLPHLTPGMRVLDAGCGEGVLSCMVAEAGYEVVGVDISGPNIEAARRLAEERGVSVDFSQGDAERLPFPDASFDVVLSSHVLEHLPDMHRGLQELHRVSKGLVLIAMPTCLNPACWALLGGDSYWRLSKRSLLAVPLGLLKTGWALVTGRQGPDEGYAGHKELPHVWRFPWRMRRQIEAAGFEIVSYEAGPLIVPYLAQYVTSLQALQPRLDGWRSRPLLRNLGYGTMVVCRKRATTP